MSSSCSLTSMPAKFASTSQQINRSKRPLECEEIPLNLPFSSLCTEQPEGPKRRKLLSISDSNSVPDAQPIPPKYASKVEQPVQATELISSPATKQIGKQRPHHWPAAIRPLLPLLHLQPSAPAYPDPHLFGSEDEDEKDDWIPDDETQGEGSIQQTMIRLPTKARQSD